MLLIEYRLASSVNSKDVGVALSHLVETPTSLKALSVDFRHTCMIPVRTAKL